jgi:hypothetical protein
VVRKRRSRAEIEARVAEFAASGLMREGFADSEACLWGRSINIVDVCIGVLNRESARCFLLKWFRPKTPASGWMTAASPPRLKRSPGLDQVSPSCLPQKPSRARGRNPRLSTSPYSHHVHFTPTSASWLNLVERLFSVAFAKIVEHRVLQVRDCSMAAAANTALGYLNRDPKPFLWTADADLILGKIQRLSKRISDSGH